MIKRCRGQSTIEYILMFTVVMAVLLFYVMGVDQPPLPNGDPDLSDYQKGLNAVYSAGADRMANNTTTFFDSLLNHTAAPAN